MHFSRTPDHDRDAEQEFVGHLARAVVGRVAPEELGLFAETEADYFRDPRAALKAGSRDEAVGFGLEMALMTPYVLAVGAAVARFLGTVVSDAVRDQLREELKPVVAGRVRWLLRRDDPVQADHRESGGQIRAPGLTAAQAREVRRVALQQAIHSGLDEQKAALLADAFVGALVTG